MGTFVNPDGDNEFIRVLKKKKSGLFVDKTDFIRITNSLLDEDGLLLAMTRPRRFGKSVMAGMLSAYYSKGYEGREIFKGLKISLKEKTESSKIIETCDESVARNIEYEPDDSYLKHLNKFDVIYIDMNVIRSMYKRYVKKSQKAAEVDNLIDFLEYKVIAELKEEENFSQILEKCQIGNTGMLEALISLRKYLNKQFVFIMDEWDLIYREYPDDADLQDEYIELLRGLFKSSPGLECFSLVYLTGILPIKKENSESALNNFRQYNMLKPGKYEEYFGFTDADIRTLIQSPQCKLSYQKLKSWYNGYKLNGKDIYNPNSVITAIDEEKCDNYWRGTSANREAARLINLNYQGLKEDIILLIDGEQIRFNCASFKNDMKSFNNKDDIISLLVCLGYLGCVDSDIQDAKNDDKNQNDADNAFEEKDEDIRIAYVPNREIRKALVMLVNQENWFRIDEIIRPSEELFDAICALNGQKAAEMIGKIHNSPDISLLGYNSEEALVYCVISALIWKTHGLYQIRREEQGRLPAEAPVMKRYQIRREEQGGKGRADLIYEPNAGKPNLPILVIELKNDHSAQEAIDQIKEKQYYSRYLDEGYSNEILLLGISYDSKTKEHECLIEKVERS